MSLVYFAHDGVEHATATEAAEHSDNNAVVIVAVTLAVLVLVVFVIQILARHNKPAKLAKAESKAKVKK